MEEFESLPVVLQKFDPLRKSLKKLRPKRFMTKNGCPNIHSNRVPLKPIRYAKDFANTLVTFRWRYVMSTVILLHTFFFVIFAGFFMFDAWISGDFSKNDGFCIDQARHFTGYLLLSIETITSTGYGYIYPTENCKLAWVILWFSTLVMIIIDGAFISVVFLKISRPAKDDSLRIFSKNAVICLRNGKLQCIVRVFDYLSKHAIDPKIDLFLVFHKDRRVTDLTPNLHQLEVSPSCGLLFYPTEICHEINLKSPLWTLSAMDLILKKFEIFVVVSGSSPITGQFSISQTSYLNEEILWGCRFKQCLDFDGDKKEFYVNKCNLFNVCSCDTPLCSAKDLLEIIEYQVVQ